MAQVLKKSSALKIPAFHASFLNTIRPNIKITTTGAEESDLLERVSQQTGPVVSVASTSTQDREKHFLNAIIPNVCFNQ